jgi:hypothetical protein
MASCVQWSPYCIGTGTSTRNRVMAAIISRQGCLYYCQPGISDQVINLRSVTCYAVAASSSLLIISNRRPMVTDGYRSRATGPPTKEPNKAHGVHKVKKKH